MNPRVLIIADSRGRGIETVINNLNDNYNVSVVVHPGAGLELAVLRSIPTIRHLQPALVLMLAGICDLTWKNKNTKVINLRHTSVSDNVTQVMDAIKSSFDLLKANGDYIISFSTITGADLRDCNYKPRAKMNDSDYTQYCAARVPHPAQTTLNQSILTINKLLVKFNKRNGTKTAWVAGLVHAYANKSYHHHYRRLRDGCHPSNKTMHAWAAQIVKSICRILPMPNRIVNESLLDSKSEES